MTRKMKNLLSNILFSFFLLVQIYLFYAYYIKTVLKDDYIRANRLKWLSFFSVIMAILGMLLIKK